ncbi:MAG TPA: TAXI family TRAP transporter solute-binding subunit, partial [Nevskiaceae bacterium]
AALVQNGVTASGDTSDIASIGSLFYEPLAIYCYGKQPLMRLYALRGGRIGIGAAGSGTRVLALAPLGANDIDASNADLEPLEGNATMDALIAHRVNATFLSAEPATVANFRTLMQAPNVHLLSFEYPEPYLLRFRYLSKLTISAAAFDIGADPPRHDVTLLASTVRLLVHFGTSPEPVDLLIQAAQKINGRGPLLEKPGEFPAALRHSWPFSDEAVRYYKSGRTFLYRVLPFWLASLISCLWVMIVPLVVVVIPALQFAPTSTAGA